MMQKDDDVDSDMTGIFLVVFAITAVLSIGFAIGYITYDKK